MLAATKVKMSGSEKEKRGNKNTFHVVVVRNKSKVMYKKVCTCKVDFSAN